MAKIRKRDTGEQGNRGEFGTVRRSDADVAVSADTADPLVERFGFDVRTADPVEFDEHAQAAAKELSKARSRHDSQLHALHRAIGDRKQPSGAWGKSDEQTLQAAREWVMLADGGAASEPTGARIRQPLRDAEQSQQELEDARRASRARSCSPPHGSGSRTSGRRSGSAEDGIGPSSCPARTGTSIRA